METEKEISYYDKLFNYWTSKYGINTAKEKLDKLKKSYKQKDRKPCQTDEYRKNCSIRNSGKNNGMFGKSVYDIWLSKYGKEIADKKKLELSIKRSEMVKGNKNKMFGKPSPNGSGNGWSGWYKKVFFKSLRELNCMIIFDEQNIDYKSCECKEFKIEYIDWDGKKRNYYPDFFLIKEKIIIECKPEHLFKSANVLCKQKSALEFCNKNNYTYQLMDPGKISTEKLISMYNNGLIKFIDRYEKKFKEKYL